MSTRLPTCLVRWLLERGRQRLTCQVVATPDATEYKVTTVPHWDIGAAAIESFTASRQALCRHAAIVAQLRDAGWNLVAHTS